MTEHGFDAQDHQHGHLHDHHHDHQQDRQHEHGDQSCEIYLHNEYVTYDTCESTVILLNVHEITFDQIILYDQVVSSVQYHFAPSRAPPFFS